MTHEERIEAVARFFLTNPRWATSNEISEATGVSPSALRKVANETAELISSRSGYLPANLATKTMVTAHAAELCSRASAINHRADRLLKKYG